MLLQRVKITIPRFKLEYEIELQSVLKSLGIQKVFNSSQADFSLLTNTLAIDTVKHQAVIEVDESRTEAAGVTFALRAVSATRMSQFFVIEVNRPFFFAICDDNTEAILFMGNVVEPE